VTNRIDDVIREAVARGLVDAAVVKAEKHGHPWPVVVLTAIGALLASLPICGLLTLAVTSGNAYGNNDAELYVLGCLVLAGSVAPLRVKPLSLFPEYLSICLLGSSLFMLWIPGKGATSDMVCAIAAIAALISVPQPLVRTLCSAIAVFMLNIAIMRLDADTMIGQALVWNRWTVTALAWLAGHVILRHAEHSERYALAALSESALVGSGAVIVVMLGYSSGQTFLMSQILPGDGWISGHADGLLGSAALLSAGVALAAGVWLFQLKLFARHWVCMVSVPFVLMSFFADALGALLLISVACIAWQRPHLAKLAGVAALWSIGSLYYALEWTLLYKAALLLLVAGLFWLASLRIGTVIPQPAQLDSPVPMPERRWTRSALLCPAVLALAIVNVGIVQKEQLIRQGQTVFVALAPVDPRSLMQGDYMALNFALPAEMNVEGPASRLAIARRGERGIATITRFHDGTSALQDDEFLVEIQRQGNRNVLATNAWHFEEGDAGRWDKASYGEFRIDHQGKAILVGLRGPSLEEL